MWRSARLAAVALLAMSAAAPAQAGGFFCLWDCYRPPLPVHVYDYTRGPTWTPNGWSYVPVEVIFPPPAPYELYGDRRGRWIAPDDGRRWRDERGPGLK